MYNSVISYGRYKCIKQIGRGGMSEVYLCTDNNIGKKWALKVINSDSDYKSIAKSEIMLLKSLDYASFPRITDAFICDRKICIVTDYIEGRTLDSVLREEGRLPENVAYDYFLTLVRALIYLHSLKPPILYLDMKPSNIMVKSDGTIQLIDFGIAQTILNRGRGYGSRGYSPPEQYEEDGVLDERSDIYALGMTMYALLSGHLIKSEHDDAVKHIKNDKSINLPLKNIILQCILYDKEDRPYPKDVEKMLLRLNSSKRSIILAGLSAVSVTVIFFTLLFFALRAYKAFESRKYADEMLKEASKYVTDSGYSRQGIKIICAYIDGNFLDEKTEEYFTYEAAKNYFEVQRDYVSAKRYFERLSVKEYPEVEYYIKLCRLLTGFDRDSTEIKDVVMQFKQYNESLRDAEIKQENTEMLNLILKENGLWEENENV